MKILMVCSENICRSPLAAGVLKRKLDVCQIVAEVDSAGFEPYHLGETADHHTVSIAKKHGVDITGHSMRLFTARDFDAYNQIYVMDHKSYRDVMFLTRDVEDKQKVDYLLNAILPGQNKMIPNPYSHDPEELNVVYHLIEKACTKIAGKLKK